MRIAWLSKKGPAVCLLLFSQVSFASQCPDSPPLIDAQHTETLWQSDFSNGLAAWGEVKLQFGVENIAFVSEPDGRFPKFARIHYPKGSYDPGTARKGLAPMGGAQFTSNFASMEVPPSDSMVLSYSVRFDEGFDFVRGGKLPGLYGGIPRAGGQVPTGRDGYSTRIVWQNKGKGALYAYLPTNSKVYKGTTYGTLVGAGAWQFEPGKWTDLSQRIKLNKPGVSDGRITIWVDGALVHDECGLRFRDIPSLKINGIFFSTFFGGNEPDWASRNDTHIDFTNFRLSRVKTN